MKARLAMGNEPFFLVSHYNICPVFRQSDVNSIYVTVIRFTRIRFVKSYKRKLTISYHYDKHYVLHTIKFNI